MDMSRLPLGEGDQSFVGGDDSYFDGGRGGGASKKKGSRKANNNADATKYMNDEDGVGPDNDRSQWHNEEDFEDEYGHEVHQQ